ncbi:MAG: CCA tRNA nucleotidyltransferase [Methyloligellaceae bacterium]
MSHGRDTVAGVNVASADWLAQPETRRVFAVLCQDGHEARVVGGAVRNTLLGQSVGDIDFATTARPQEVIDLAGRAGLKTILTGVDHGTVTIVADGRPFEVTTLRRDVETFGRHAKVAFTDDWAADARRRDFTMNALYAAADGTVFDPLGGVRDLEARRVRFIGDAGERIREDYLRILRFFRFNAVYGAPPFDREGLAACVRGRAGLAALSAERIHAELVRLLAAEGALAALEAMFDYGLLVDVLGGVGHLGRFRRLLAIEAAHDAPPSPMRRLAALTVVVIEDVERLTARFRLSKAERGCLAGASRFRGVSEPAEQGDVRRMLYRLGPQCFEDAVLLAWAEAGAALDDPAWRRLHALPERWQAPEFPLSGADIVRLGTPEGPAVGRVLRAVEEAWISAGFVGDKDSLMARARTCLENDE